LDLHHIVLGAELDQTIAREIILFVHHGNITDAKLLGQLA
jgi:hypothetical protein